jgi:hypothetical protein
MDVNRPAIPQKKLREPPRSRGLQRKGRLGARQNDHFLKELIYIDQFALRALHEQHADSADDFRRAGYVCRSRLGEPVGPFHAVAGKCGTASLHEGTSFPVSKIGVTSCILSL